MVIFAGLVSGLIVFFVFEKKVIFDFIDSRACRSSKIYTISLLFFYALYGKGARYTVETIISIFSHRLLISRVYPGHRGLIQAHVS